MNKKKWIIIDIILIIAFFLAWILEFNKLLEADRISDIMMLPQEEIINALLFPVLVSFFVTLLRFFFVAGIYICVRLAIKKFYKEKLSKIDFQNYKGYFRDILKGVSPAELSYIDDFNLNYPKDYVAVLLSLKNKGVIDFDELYNKIYILNSEAVLSKTEQLIINSINDGKLEVKDNQKFNLSVQEDALNHGVLKKTKNKLTIKKFFVIFFVLIVLLISSSTSLFKMILTENIYLIVLGIVIEILVLCAMMGVIFLFPIYGIVYFLKKARNPYVRSEKGEEINLRLEGLKNYLKDFSVMNERSAEELIIWEDYLIYSVLFNQNSKVVNEIYNNYFKS